MYVDKEHGESQEAKVGVTGGEGAGADEGSGLVRTVPTTLGFGFRLGVGAGDRLRASAGPVRARKVGGARGEAPLQEEPTADGRPTWCEQYEGFF